MVAIFYGQGLVGLSAANSQLGMIMTKHKSTAQKENLLLFEELFNRFSNIAVTRFDWTGLPDSVNERFLNQTLYLFGMSAFFESEELGYITLPCTMAGEYNIYYEPTAINAFSFNYNKQLYYNDFVLIRNNPTCTPTAFPVFEYTRRMSDVLRTIDVLCKKMKQPFIIICEEKQRLTYQNMFKNIQDNEPLILGMKDYDLKKSLVEVVPTQINQDLVKMWEVFHSYENLLYTALGIESVGESKRERMLVDEVNANNMVTEISMEVTLKELKMSCERINKKYGLSIGVNAKTIQDYREGMVSEDGKIYDRTAATD